MHEPLPMAEWRVTDKDSAVKCVRAQIERVRARHELVFVPVPNPSPVMVREQKKNYTLLMTEYGVAVGLIEMARLTGFLDDVGYAELRREALKLTMPGCVGVVGG